MEFDGLSADVEWEAKRVAAAFGVEELSVSFTIVGVYADFEGYVRGTLVTWDIELDTLILGGISIGRFPDDYSQVVYRIKEGDQWVCESNSADGELMARGLYCLDIQDEGVLAELDSPLTAHEKLELKLSMPREFWPKTWLDEETSR
jgi:hypothetical protein